MTPLNLQSTQNENGNQNEANRVAPTASTGLKRTYNHQNSQVERAIAAQNKTNEMLEKIFEQNNTLLNEFKLLREEMKSMAVKK